MIKLTARTLIHEWEMRGASRVAQHEVEAADEERRHATKRCSASGKDPRQEIKDKNAKKRK